MNHKYVFAMINKCRHMLLSTSVKASSQSGAVPVNIMENRHSDKRQGQRQVTQGRNSVPKRHTIPTTVPSNLFRSQSLGIRIRGWTTAWY